MNSPSWEKMGSPYRHTITTDIFSKQYECTSSKENTTCPIKSEIRITCAMLLAIALLALSLIEDEFWSRSKAGRRIVQLFNVKRNGTCFIMTPLYLTKILLGVLRSGRSSTAKMEIFSSSLHELLILLFI